MPNPLPLLAPFERSGAGGADLFRQVLLSYPLRHCYRRRLLGFVSILEEALELVILGYAHEGARSDDFDSMRYCFAVWSFGLFYEYRNLSALS